jgi:alpha-amylase/alpha-mannosidase (GH57 family)
VHPSDLAAREPTDTLRVPWATSWADTERDASAWLGNQLQQAAFNRLNRLYGPVWATHDADFLDTWRRLSTSDHLYYMSTKRLADAEVHAYFNPYANPYDAFIAYMNVLQDLEQRVEAAGAGAAVRDRVLEPVGAERDLTQPATPEAPVMVATAIAERQVTSPRDASTPRAPSRSAKGSAAKGRRVNAKGASRTRAKEPREPG